MQKMIILGGGLAGLSLAYFLQDIEKNVEILILEKQERPGGLCQSFHHDKISFDIGPHILFSKDKEILDLLISLLGENVQSFRRSNKIIYKNRLINYPFENDLSKLPDADLKYCVEKFLQNPYENYNACNMLQFFLKTFGEGITSLYLRPYNEKIWKFDPVFMNTQMVERIPKPPKEDIIRSANGETVDGYLHQLNFFYPMQGGIENLINVIINKLKKNVHLSLNETVEFIRKEENKFKITTNKTTHFCDVLISTIPVRDLVRIDDGHDKPSAGGLVSNSLIIGLVQIKNDRMCNDFVFTIPDKKVVFHRITKLDFLGDGYKSKECTSYVIEISYRKGDAIDSLKNDELIETIEAGLLEIQFINHIKEIRTIILKKIDDAYVVYDLEHETTIKTIKDYFSRKGIILHGRNGEHEYWNMDRIVLNSKILSKRLSEML